MLYASLTNANAPGKIPESWEDYVGRIYTSLAKLTTRTEELRV